MMYNIIIAGMGGQGVLTLGSVLANAAMLEGKNVKTSELHGLAMRFGPLEAHVRIGECYSPLVNPASADIIFGLEPLEGLRALKYASPGKTVIVCDSKPLVPINAYIRGEKYPSLAEIEKKLKKHCKRVFLVDASERARAETGGTLAANVFLLGVAAGKKLLPLNTRSIEKQLEITLMSKPAAFAQNKRLFQQGMKVK